MSSINDWRALKYGMFIHYGMSTFVANDYGSGKEPASQYAPKEVDVDQWIRVARDAGMKYAMLAAKHAAGHCLWDSKVQFRGKEFAHDVANSGGVKTDVVAAYVAACKKYGVAPGLYWCFEDHHNKAVPRNMQRKPPLPEEFFQFAKDQLTELVTKYPEVHYYWLDIPAAATLEQRRALYDLIKGLNPNIVILYNFGKATPKGPLSEAMWPTDVINSEANLHQIPNQRVEPLGRFKEQTKPLGYERCYNLRVKRWFWIKDDQNRPVTELLNVYKQVVLRCEGNLLLNVPPDITGHIPEDEIKALMELKKQIDELPTETK